MFAKTRSLNYRKWQNSKFSYKSFLCLKNSFYKVVFCFVVLLVWVITWEQAGFLTQKVNLLSRPPVTQNNHGFF